MGRRGYAYDAAGNRTGESSDCWDFQEVVEPATGHLLQRKSINSTTCSAQATRQADTYTYDADGRVASKTGFAMASGAPARRIEFVGGTGGSRNAALGAVFRAVRVNGLTYDYYYDANGRRRLKISPTGSTEEYFWDGDKLLEERGNAGILTASYSFTPAGATTPSSAASHPLDEYIWLDGRPVALIKSKLGTCFTKVADAEGTAQDGGNGDCTRNGEFAPCGIYFIVTDYLKKPVLLLNGALKVAGTGDYDAFGNVNRVTYSAELTQQDRFGDGAADPLGFFNQPAGATNVQVRARFAGVDTDAGEFHYAYLSSRSGQEFLRSNGTAFTRVGGPGQGAAVTPWVESAAAGTAGGGIDVRFQSGSPANAARSVVLEGYEYRRYETGATPVWTPLRFPGQYHDAETDLFENWNRYYDPSIGRYLGPEPRMVDAGWVIAETGSGRPPSIYGYAAGNPILFSDPNGLALVNNSPYPVPVKPEGDGVVVWVQPGERRDEDQDGFAQPELHPGRVFKTINRVDVTVNKDGSISLSAKFDLKGDPEDDVKAEWRQLGYQDYFGGWKDQAWIDRGNPVKRLLGRPAPYVDWQDLMDAANGKIKDPKESAPPAQPAQPSQAPQNPQQHQEKKSSKRKNVNEALEELLPPKHPEYLKL